MVMKRGRVATCMYSPHARGGDDGNERVVRVKEWRIRKRSGHGKCRERKGGTGHV